MITFLGSLGHNHPLHGKDRASSPEILFSLLRDNASVWIGLGRSATLKARLFLSRSLGAT